MGKGELEDGHGGVWRTGGQKKTTKWKRMKTRMKTEPEDEDGVDGRGVYGWDVWVCGLGTVGVSSIFGLVRRSGTFATVLPTFVLVSRIHLVEQYRGHGHFLSVTSSSRHESMVGGVLTRDSDLCVGFTIFSKQTFYPSVVYTRLW